MEVRLTILSIAECYLHYKGHVECFYGDVIVLFQHYLAQAPFKSHAIITIYGHDRTQCDLLDIPRAWWSDNATNTTALFRWYVDYFTQSCPDSSLVHARSMSWTIVITSLAPAQCSD